MYLFDTNVIKLMICLFEFLNQPGVHVMWFFHTLYTKTKTFSSSYLRIIYNGICNKMINTRTQCQHVNLIVTISCPYCFKYIHWYTEHLVFLLLFVFLFAVNIFFQVELRCERKCVIRIRSRWHSHQTLVAVYTKNYAFNYTRVFLSSHHGDQDKGCSNHP